MPSEEDTFEPGAEFAPGDDLREMAKVLFDKYPDHFAIAAQSNILFRWKKLGGAGGGARTLGKCPKVSGALKYETHADFYLWLAADHCRELQLTYFQVEALLAHELCHIDMDDKGKPASASHDIEEFSFVAQHWGLWRQSLVEFGQVIRQLSFEQAL